MERFEHGGNIYAENAGCIDFSANINPLGLADSVRLAITDGIKNIINYPDPQADELKNAIATRYGVATDEIVLGNGATELFYLFFHAMRPRRVLLPVPSFNEYERAALAAKAKVNYYNLQSNMDFRIDWDNFNGALMSADCIVIGNPNNPTGSIITRNELIHLLNELKGGSQWLIVDESFIDFLLYDSRYTVRNLVDEYPHLFVVQSLTKFYSIPGLRIGFGVANRELAKKLNAAKDVWNVNILAQIAGTAALKDLAYQQKSRELLPKLQQQLVSELAKLRGVIVHKPTVNFLLLDVTGTGISSTELTAKLKRNKILVRDCANYPGIDGQYIRIAVRCAEDNAKLLAAMKLILA